jgi:hypothetical protein
MAEIAQNFLNMARAQSGGSAEGQKKVRRLTADLEPVNLAF